MTIDWEPCGDDGCWDVQYSARGHVERTFWSILSLARRMGPDYGPIAALMAWSGRWYHGHAGISPQSGERVACDTDGEAQTEYDQDGDPVTGCTDITPCTWVTMDPEVEDPRAERRGPLRMRT